MALASLIIPRLIKAYYAMDLPTVRWLVRKVLGHKQRTLLLNKFFSDHAAEMLDFVPAVSAGCLQTGNQEFRGKHRRTALYTYPFEEVADDSVRTVVFTNDNPFLIEPAPFWGKASPLVSRLIVPLPQIVCTVENGEVEGDCLGVFSKERFITMFASAASPHFFEVFSKHDVISWKRMCSFHLTRKTNIIEFDQVVFFASNGSYADNYFHALTDAIPSLLASLDTLSPAELARTKVLVPSSLPVAVRQLVDMIIAFRNIDKIEFGDTSLIRAKRIIVSPYRAQMNDIAASDRISMFHVNAADIRKVRQEIWNAIGPDKLSTTTEKIFVYLTRANLSSGRRRTINADDVAALVKAKGGVVASPESMTLEHQIELMGKAKIVICDAGAAVANAIFCKRETVFLILTQRLAKSHLFASYLQALGMRVGFVYGTEVETSYMDPAHFDIVAPINLIERAIAFFADEHGHGTPDGWQ